MNLLREDWDQILVSKDAMERLEAVQKDGTLSHVFPPLQALVGFGGGDTGHKDLWAHTKLVVHQTVPEIVARWCSLFHDVGKPTRFARVEGKIAFHGHEAAGAKIFRRIARETRLWTNEEVEEISFVIHNLGRIEAYESDWPDSAVRRLERELRAHLDTLFAVARADCTTGRPEKRKRQLSQTHELCERINALRAIDALPPKLPTGLGTLVGEMLQLDGPELGQVLKELRDRVDSNELPRNADHQVYIDWLEKNASKIGVSSK